jgi:hypothetical protein
MELITDYWDILLTAVGLTPSGSINFNSISIYFCSFDPIGGFDTQDIEQVRSILHCNTIHIYTQTIRKTTQWIEYTEEDIHTDKNT